jgi:DNA topoisomerase-1
MPAKWIHRRGKKPGHFTYVGENGAGVSDKRARQIDALAIPPAWTDVHVAASDRSAIQAWGYDARGRKQYRYHPRAIEKGQLRKYYRVRQMARDLPGIRQRVDRDFRHDGFSRDRVTAGIVRFLAEGFFRIGNERYAKENHTFGLTTLRKSHVHVKGDAVIFQYVGKRSIRHRQVVVNRSLAEFISTMLETPGRRLFRYEENGSWHDVRSTGVNDYIQAVSGFPYSAKDFRTWGGTLRAATVLAEIGPAGSQRAAKKNVVTAMRLVAAELGNTPAICRSSYVHPVVIDRYIADGATITGRKGSTRRGRGKWEYAPEERALISFLDTYFPERRRRRRNELP